MNDCPLGFAHDPDLNGSWAAMQRAAQRARDLARETNTCLVVADADGSVTRISPEQLYRIEAAWADEAEQRLKRLRAGDDDRTPATDTAPFNDE